ncbi:hypothetical protein CBM2629_U20023 [Cupriavidus taiwanensis]|nr:hypothetical protein CBM2629_U20023 [Cupriavidus taiwanensis]
MGVTAWRKRPFLSPSSRRTGNESAQGGAGQGSPAVAGNRNQLDYVRFSWTGNPELAGLPCNFRGRRTGNCRSVHSRTCRGERSQRGDRQYGGHSL